MSARQFLLIRPQLWKNDFVICVGIGHEVRSAVAYWSGEYLLVLRNQEPFNAIMCSTFYSSLRIYVTWVRIPLSALRSSTNE